MKHLKKFNERVFGTLLEPENDKTFGNLLNSPESDNSDDLDPLTIEEFSNLREAMYDVKESDSASASQAKEFFTNTENFDRVVGKLRKLLTH